MQLQHDHNDCGYLVCNCSQYKINATKTKSLKPCTHVIINNNTILFRKTKWIKKIIQVRIINFCMLVFEKKAYVRVEVHEPVLI